MKQILVKIANILWTLPNSTETTIATIMNPIDTIQQAEKFLDYLIENQINKEIMKIGYLLKHNHEIIEN